MNNYSIKKWSLISASVVSSLFFLVVGTSTGYAATITPRVSPPRIAPSQLAPQRVAPAAVRVKPAPIAPNRGGTTRIRIVPR